VKSVKKRRQSAFNESIVDTTDLWTEKVNERPSLGVERKKSLKISMADSGEHIWDLQCFFLPLLRHPRKFSARLNAVAHMTSEAFSLDQ
jgi:hypothetical protein